MASLLDLEHLIPHYAENDPRLGELIARSVYTPISQLIASVYHDPARAGEVTTDILHAVLEQLPRYPCGTSFSVWLFTLAIRHLQTEHRRAIFQKTLHFQRPAIPDPIAPLIPILAHHFQLEVAEIASIVGQRENAILQNLENGPAPGEPARTPGEGEIEQAVMRLRPYFVRQRKPARYAFGNLLQIGGEYLRIGGILTAVLVILLLFNNRSPEGGQTLFPTATPSLPPVVWISPSGNLVASIGSTVQANLPPQNTDPTLSTDGRFVVLVSNSPGLVPGDTNQSLDIFVYEIATGTVERVSVTSDGKQLNGDSLSPDISADGRYVVFASHATNVAEGISNQCGAGQSFHFCSHVYIHDRVTGLTELVSKEADGSVIDANSYLPVISGDGGTVAFWGVTEICPGAAFLGPCSDVYLRDRRTEDTLQIPANAPAGNRNLTNERALRLDLSSDGTRLLYPEFAVIQNNSSTTIFDTWKIFDRATNGSQPVFGQNSPNQGILVPRLSGDGQTVAFVSIYDGFFVDDTNLSTDVFITEIAHPTVTRLSLTPDGQQADNNSGAERLPGWYDGLGFSENGRYVVFLSTASNLVTDQQAIWCAQLSPVAFWDCYGLYLYDRETGQTEQISLPVFPLMHYLYPSISNDGRWISLLGFMPNPSENCPTGSCSSVLVFDRQTAEIRLASAPIYAVASQHEQWNFSRNIIGHESRVNAVAFSLDGQWVISGGQDGQILATNLTDDTSQAFPEQIGGVAALVIVPDENIPEEAFWVIAGTTDSHLIQWNPFTKDSGITKFNAPIRALAASPTGTTLAIATQREIRIAKFNAGIWEEQITFPQTNLQALAFSPDGIWLAIADGEEIWIRRVSDGEVITRLGGHEGRVLDVAFSPDGTYLASSGEDGRVILWHLTHQQAHLLVEYTGILQHKAWVSALAFSPEGDRLMAGTFDSTIQVWDLIKFIPIQTIRRTNQDQILALAYAPDGKALAVGTVRGIRVWQSGLPALEPRANTRFFAFQPNDLRLDETQLFPGVTAINPNPKVVFSFDEAQALVTFDILLPTLPEDQFTLNRIEIVTQPETAFEGITLAYLRTTNYQPALLYITQSNANPNTYDTRIDPSIIVQEIPFRDTLAELALGNWILNESLNPTSPPLTSMIWDEEAAAYWLRWQENNIYVAILYDTSFNQASIRANEQFTLEDLLEIAVNLR